MRDTSVIYWLTAVERTHIVAFDKPNRIFFILVNPISVAKLKSALDEQISGRGQSPSLCFAWTA